MKKILIVTMLSVSASVFAQQNNGDSYFIKSFNGQFVCVNEDKLGLCDESQKTAFELVENDNGFSLKSSDGNFVSALVKTDSDDDSLGLVGLNKQAEGREAFRFEGKEDGKSAIKSQVNTYIRANLMKGVLDQVEAANGWEMFELVLDKAAAKPVAKPATKPVKPAAQQAPGFFQSNAQQIIIYNIIPAVIGIGIVAWKFWPVVQAAQKVAAVAAGAPNDALPGTPSRVQPMRAVKALSPYAPK